MARDLSNWQPGPLPGEKKLAGRLARLEPYDADIHAEGLFNALCGENAHNIWDYIPFGPVETEKKFRETFQTAMTDLGWRPLVLLMRDCSVPSGMFSFMRLRPEAGSAEIGAILYEKKIQRTSATTEALYLSAKHIFEDCGYRRYEWKCNSENKASCRAAERFGFTYEGTFRQDMITRGKNRDTAWFSMLDHEWSAIKKMFEAWLDPQNFDPYGQQKQSLVSFQNHLQKKD